jgi:enamine deaminase RidA (YjgF/YER057c/UK114 family)
LNPREVSISLLQPAGLVHSPAFSHVAVLPAGATQILIGGQNAVDERGSLVGGNDFVAQVEQVMANLKVALAAAGATITDLVSISLAVVDGTDLRAGYAAAAAHLSGNQPPPLITAAFVSGLGVPGALLELSAVAAKLP